MNMPFGEGSLGLMDATSNDVGAAAWACCAAVPAFNWAIPGGDPLKLNMTVTMAIPAAIDRNIFFDSSLICMGTSILPSEPYPAILLRLTHS
jgi:hypothetical protein